MPLAILPARKGKKFSYDPEVMWKREDKIIPKDLDRGVIDNFILLLAQVQMALEKLDYSQMYYPFFKAAVKDKAFRAIERKNTEQTKTYPNEWKWIKETYDTNDTFLVFTRLSK